MKRFNKIEAKDKSLADMLFNKRYKIDVFQREYRWKYQHIDALISDVTGCFRKCYKEGDTIRDYNGYDSYYMGPVVLCEDDLGDLSIVDGQQRLTSFLLLLIYLQHKQDELELPVNMKKDLYSFIFVKKQGESTFTVNVESRKDVMDMLVDNPSQMFSGFEEKGESVQNIMARYYDITYLFPSELQTAEVLPIFIEWMLEKVTLVEVRANSMDSAYTIFETMNDRGLTLVPTEILKGYLLSKIVENNPQNEEKAEKANDFWNSRIQDIRIQTGSDTADMDFFRGWLRGRYAETQRKTKPGAENEDFEKIGTQFHVWVKGNTSRISLKKPEDYYYFIKSDFDFYSTLYLRLYDYKTTPNSEFELLYVNNFYTIADSLTYPLYMSAILKTDGETEINSKIGLVAQYIDRLANIRTLSHKSITQSSIRNLIYENVKGIRSLNTADLKLYFDNEIDRVQGGNPILERLQPMNNWGYFHYFFARILYCLKEGEEDFKDLLRSRKQSSYVLFQIFRDEDLDPDENPAIVAYLNSVANYCLVRRKDANDFDAMDNDDRLNAVLTAGYLPEMNGDYEDSSMIEFIQERDKVIAGMTEKIWGEQ
jgi:hypothetical protein